MAYDRAKELQLYSDFFKTHLINDSEISRFSQTTKIPKQILNSIKYEYSSFNSTKGLFSISKIMGYLFVFDYFDDKSLDDMIELCITLMNDEQQKGLQNKETPVKSFVCNKYPYMMDDGSDLSREEIAESYTLKDPKARQIIEKIDYALNSNHTTKNRDESERKFLRALKNTYFTSCKNNLGIENAFLKIFNDIKETTLYENTEYEEPEKHLENNKEVVLIGEDDDNKVSFFCCAERRKKDMGGKGGKEKIKKEEERKENNFMQDDSDEYGYDMNQIIKQKKNKGKTPQDKEEEFKEKDVTPQNKKCLIF
jgi:hypothetical protein